MLLRIFPALVVSIMCSTLFACAKGKPSADMEHARIKNEAAVTELRKLAEEGNASAQNRLGLFYKVGRGVAQNYGQAKRWFEEAAKQGNPEAQINLGMLYLQADAPPRSPQMALFWFGRAAEQGVVEAFARLGQMYQEAEGVPQDFVQAYMWLELAATKGEARSAENRDMLAAKMTYAQLGEAQRLAREWKPTQKAIASKSLRPIQTSRSNF